MKTLYLVRHAKSSWKDSSLKDFDRHLNKRGLHDAPMMGKVLNKMKIEVDFIISSPAKRTKDTAQIIAREIGFLKEIRFDVDLYEATLEKLLSKIRNFDININKAMIVGHNPGLTRLANYLSKEFITNIPTCGVVALTFDNSWQNTTTKDCKIIFFEYPKKQ